MSSWVLVIYLISIIVCRERIYDLEKECTTKKEKNILSGTSALILK